MNKIKRNLWGTFVVAALLIGFLASVKTLFPEEKPDLIIEPDPVIESNPVTVNRSREDIRRETGVRELLPLENEKKISRLPTGVFGYAIPSLLNRLNYIDSIPLDRDSWKNRRVEVHKTSRGNIVVLIYITQSALTRLQDPNRKDPLHTHAFFEKHREYDRLIGIPHSHIIMWDSRSAEFDNQEKRFVEIKIR